MTALWTFINMRVSYKNFLRIQLRSRRREEMGILRFTPSEYAYIDVTLIFVDVFVMGFLIELC